MNIDHQHQLSTENKTFIIKAQTSDDCDFSFHVSFNQIQ